MTVPLACRSSSQSTLPATTLAFVVAWFLFGWVMLAAGFGCLWMKPEARRCGESQRRAYGFFGGGCLEEAQGRAPLRPDMNFWRMAGSSLGGFLGSAAAGAAEGSDGGVAGLGPLTSKVRGSATGISVPSGSRMTFD